MKDWPGVNWVWMPVVDSTNALAERLLEAWLADAEAVLPPTLIFADTQWVGRGRDGRRWHSPRGGVYASFLTRVERALLPWVPLVAGVAVLQGVRSLVPTVTRALKWPNDLEVNGRKLGGILCSSRVQEDQAWVVTGFGVNVTTTPLLPGEQRKAVSLADLGYTGSFEAARLAILDVFVTSFPGLLSNPGEARHLWLSASVHGPLDTVQVRTPTGWLQGQFVDLSPQGLLILQTQSGIVTVASGEIL